MSKNHEGDIKQYVVLSEAWYGDANLKTPRPETKPYLKKVENVMFGFYCPDGGTSGEMAMNWYLLGDDKTASACLECWNDAWHTLAQFKDVIDALADVDNEDISPKQFTAILDKCGFVDATPRKRK